MTALLALCAVLALLLVAAKLARRFGLAGAVARPGAAASGRRLQLVESLALDPRRRLLLVRCDGEELLLLTGGPNDLQVSRVTRPPVGGETLPPPA